MAHWPCTWDPNDTDAYPELGAWATLALEQAQRAAAQHAAMPPPPTLEKRARGAEAALHCDDNGASVKRARASPLHALDAHSNVAQPLRP